MTNFSSDSLMILIQFLKQNRVEASLVQEIIKYIPYPLKQQNQSMYRLEYLYFTRYFGNSNSSNANSDQESDLSIIKEIVPVFFKQSRNAILEYHVRKSIDIKRELLEILYERLAYSKYSK